MQAHTCLGVRREAVTILAARATCKVCPFWNNVKAAKAKSSQSRRWLACLHADWQMTNMGTSKGLEVGWYLATIVHIAPEYCVFGSTNNHNGE